MIITLYLTLLTSILSVSATIITDPKKASSENYDYIIAGGGLTGLTAAARLTQNKKVSVLVIESGFLQSYRPIIENVTNFGQAFGSTMDHGFQTSSLGINGRPLTIHSGNGLGGSTLINGVSYTSPAKIQIDSWESHLGNKGWNWQILSSYIHKSERARLPTPEQIEAGHFFDPQCHGTNGAIHVGARDTGVRYSPMIRSVMKMLAGRGVPTRKDLNCGNPRGISMLLNTVHENQTRSDAARDILLPIMDRPNLSILVGYRVGRVLIDTSHSPPAAKGVEFGTDGEKFEVYARHDTLLAAGALVSPLILEYSGIGLKSVLDAVGIQNIVELPVGQNLQDQTTTSLSTTIHPNGAGQGQAIYFASWNELFTDSTRKTARGLLGSQLDQWAQDAVSKGGFGNVTALKAQMELYRDWILDHDVAYAELFIDTSSTNFGFSSWVLLPFSRGYVHIMNKDPYLWQATRNPRYMENDLDRYAQAAASLLARKITQDDLMQHYIREETFPGSAVPQNATLDDWVSHNTQNFGPNYHAIGTCAMMAKHLGGVVDHSGRVYGVLNLRVIDASILPTQVSAHTAALLYGMTERLSDLILADYHA